MSFRRRMILLAAGAVAAAVVLASFVVYVVTRDELRGQVDASLRQKLTPSQPEAVQVQAEYVDRAKLAKLEREGKGSLGIGLSTSSLAVGGSSRATAPVDGKGAIKGTDSLEGKNVVVGKGSTATAPLPGFGPLGAAELTAHPALLATTRLGDDGRKTFVRVVLPAQKLGGATGYAQLVQSNGQVLRSDGTGSGLPITAATRAVAAGRHPAFLSDATVAGTHVRVLTEHAPLAGGVLQVALPLTDVDTTLAHLELVLAVVSLGGIALAAALGLLVSRAALVPVRRLTGAAEEVARTQDLGHRIPVGDGDELGRLAASFNTMLAALERSRLAQRQLVSDASHELRTPLTSVRANLDALAMGARLPERDRARVIAAARAQLSELTVLVGDLVDLSNTEIDALEVEAVRLDLAAAGAVERARLHWAGGRACTFTLDAEPCLVRAAPARLDRAIANLLDNAVKWNPPFPSAGPVEMRVRDGRLQVRDHGPGISLEDLPRVFDRFYRAPAARGLPGSGLGLAIVRHFAETHGGSVHAANDPGGGARLTLELPALGMTASESAAYEPAAADAVQQVPQIL
jgi:two-component system, OmpR family, sensor histidine kinase MprB